MEGQGKAGQAGGAAGAELEAELLQDPWGQVRQAAGLGRGARLLCEEGWGVLRGLEDRET